MSNKQNDIWDEMNYDEIQELKPLNSTIQVCPYCKKIDVYKDDGHSCNAEHEAERQQNLEHYN